MTSDNPELQKRLWALDHKVGEDYRKLVRGGVDPTTAAARARRLHQAECDKVLDALAAAQRAQPTEPVVPLAEFRKMRAFHPDDLQARLKR
jgi:hypothetical protein